MTKRSRRQSRFTVLAVALGLLLAAAWSTAGTATAYETPGARFVWESCDPALPGGSPPPEGVGWHANPGVAVQFYDSCAQTGGSFGIQETGATSDTAAWAEVGFGATQGVFVESLTISGGTAALGPGNDHTYVDEEGWPAANLGESQRTWLIRTKMIPETIWSHSGEGAGFDIHWNCDGNYAPGCGAGPIVWVRHMAATMVDTKPPAVKVEGPLLAGGVLRGHQALSASATDVGGGLTKVEVLVNGLPAATPVNGTCAVGTANNTVAQGTVALSATPCPPSLEASWSLNTAAAPFQEGANTVQVCASDFATIGEPNKTCSPATAVTVDDSCTESGIPGGEVLSAEFAGNHKEDVTKRYGKGAEITGELADQAGDVISGATVCVEAEQEGSTAMTPVGTATTDGTGHFAYVLPPGPNRKLLVGYRRDSFQVARSVGFFSRTKPTIHIGPGKVHNGDRITISGKLPGGRLAARRVVVVKASALHSKKWYPFGETTTNGKGEYHLRYRFTDTTRKTIYRMEAFVPRQDHYPFEEGHSKPALVEVRR